MMRCSVEWQGARIRHGSRTEAAQTRFYIGGPRTESNRRPNRQRKITSESDRTRAGSS